MEKVIFLDIETYSKGEKPDIANDRIILIGYKEVDRDPKQLVAYPPSDREEQRILEEFYKELSELSRSYSITLCGFNILRFDIPALIVGGKRHWNFVPGSEEKFENFWHKILTIDIQQILLPLNNFKFLGLRLDYAYKKIIPGDASNKETGKKIEIEEVLDSYEKGDYSKLMEKNRKDLEKTEKIYKALNRDMMKLKTSGDK